ncbi:MAG: right-handed parallel beta-helix repeat-containing protein [Kiritimatiellae bacterium]|nr:right-handed parallel beta-helix repeat-containing protein [Kiritimatiellia bacterium]
MKKLAYGIVWAFAAMAAANVFAAGTLPSGYTEIEYIQGPGNGRFVTDYTPQPNTDKIEAVVEWPANTIAANVNQAVWCARGNGLSVDSWTLFILGTQFRFDYMPSGNAVSLTPDFTISTGTKYTITAEDNTVTYSANGAVLQTQSTPAFSFTAGSALALFSSHHSGINSNLGNYGKQKLYSFKVWRSGDLIHYFVPCKDSGGNATLVDICDEPATLTRSGSFTAGSEGHYYDDNLFPPLSILPIPDQLCLPGTDPEPGFTVSNTVTGAYWVFADGGVASGATPFDVAYSFNDGVGTVTVTGKTGGEYEGETVRRRFAITDELLVNGGFESGAWAPGWTASGNYAKIDTSGSAYQPNQTTAFISGKYCAILQKVNVATQVFTNDAAYRAELSWKCKRRGGYGPVPYSMLIDGVEVFYESLALAAVSSYYPPTSPLPSGHTIEYRRVGDIVLAPGEHTLEIQTKSTIDRTLFLDDVSLKMVSTNALEIQPIPNQSCADGACRPEFTVENRTNGHTWRIGGDIDSGLFDVTYEDNTSIGIAKVTVSGKGELAGEGASATFGITEDDTISTSDATARRLVAGGDIVYVFTNGLERTTLTPKRELFLADMLLVGGGGAGGNQYGGGGGGGGVISITNIFTSYSAGGSIEFTVGAGGAVNATDRQRGGNGGRSWITLGGQIYTAKGGGGGGGWSNTPGAGGGSGGGGSNTGAGGAGTAGQGYAGATGAGGSKSGGGGGAGHAGYAYTTDDGGHAGNGGEGIANSITGVSVLYGGGGGGGSSNNGVNNLTPGTGGAGGGGNGGKGTIGQNGVNGLGGGGGGGGDANDHRRGGSGGSGTVIFRFRTNDFAVEPIPMQPLAAGGSTPDPVVRAGGTLLEKGVDYDVAYEGNTAPGRATMTITGKVAYASFEISTRYFLKPTVASEGDGLSWATAMSVANFFATHGNIDSQCEVWIASGTVPAAALLATNTAPLVIRGGFAGTEASLDERAEGTLTVLDGTQTVNCLLKITNTADLEIERIKFCNARANGFIKEGAGGLTVRDCVIEANGKSVNTSWGRGMNVQSAGAGVLVVTDCVFAGNRCTSGDTQYGGFGIYVKSFGSAIIDRSLFVTNGYDIRRAETPSGGGWDYCGMSSKGSAALVIDTPVTVRNSRFAGNCCPLRKSLSAVDGSGGALTLTGACGGSRVENCVFVGNIDRRSQGLTGDEGSGALAVYLNSAAAKVAVNNCTFAYNITAGSKSSGGVTVLQGSADIENTIFWKNRRYHLTLPGYGTDVQAHANGSARIAHSLVTALDGTALGGANLTVDEDSVFAGDPKLVTSTDDFENQLTYTDTTVYYDYSRASRYEDLASIDVHLLSAAGYCVNGGAVGPATSDYSPAIDVGDADADYSNEPAPNGGRLNLGAYGNTPEASRSAIGQPEATVAVTFPGGWSRPKVTVTMGLESGTGYSATVQLVCKVGGEVLAVENYSRVGSDDVIEYLLPQYLPVGTVVTAVAIIAASGAETIVRDGTGTAAGEVPAFYGKGGGPNVIHVRTGADCKMDGTSWTDAYPDLATALASAPDASKTEIWLSVTNDFTKQQIALVGSLTVRGGFAGVENSPEERSEGLQSSLDGISYTYRGLDFNVPSGATLTVERIRFAHASQSGIRKTGAGDLLVRDCSFTGRKQSEYNLQGGGIYASGGTATVTNCQFVNLIDYSVNALSSYLYGGDGIYLSSCAQAYVDDCLFATNGIQFNRNKGAQARHTGSAVYVSATPAVFRNCRFASNGAAIMDGAASGGTVYFTGNCDGSKLINCVFVGNAEFEGSQSAAEPVSGGAIACNMSAATQTLDIENCTVAYNLTLGYKTGAGINVYQGTVNLRNSIVYGNVRGRQTAIAGADIQVHAAGALNMSYTLVTGLTSNYVHSVNAENLTIGPGVISGVDPLLATTTNDVANLLVAYGATVYLPQSARAACAAFDVHPRTRTGYIKDGVLIRDPERVESPTIDKGDPTSDYSKEPQLIGIGGNGGRVNLGFSGNTPEAALTRRTGSVYYLR